MLKMCFYILCTDVLYYEDDVVKNTSRDANGEDRDSPFLSLIVVISVLSLLVFFSLLSFTIYRSRFGKKSTIDGTTSSTRSFSSPSSAAAAVERRVTSPPIDGFRRPTSVGLLSTPESDIRDGQLHQASAMSLDRESCYDAPSHRDPYQLRILMQSGGSPHLSDPWRKTQHMMAEMTSLRLFGRHSDDHSSVTDHPTPYCPYHHHHHHDKFRSERDDES